jgi:tellurite resistance protein
MSALPENPSLNGELARMAQSHADSAQQQYATTFDFSENSLGWVDDAIAKFHPDGNVEDNTLLGFGAYVGETIRRALGGVWVQDERGVALLQKVGGGEHSASPFSWVQKRFTNGMDDSVKAKYAALKQQVGRVGVRIAVTTPAKAAATAITDEESELLARAPLLAFLLVAAADGKVDKKELTAFAEIVDAMMAGAPPLLQKAMSEMLPQMARFANEAGDRNPVEDMERVASVLDTHFPNEAEMFKRTLVAIAIKVASSSGGFLGMGSKISKDEKIAIAAIAITLGLAGDEE